MNLLQEQYMWLVLAFMLTMSTVCLALMCIDKYRAKRQEGRRYPEKLLLGLSLLGGSFGTLLAMVFLRHKINARRHPAFAIGVPVMALAHCVLLLVLLMQSVK